MRGEVAMQVERTEVAAEYRGIEVSNYWVYPSPQYLHRLTGPAVSYKVRFLWLINNVHIHNEG